jgi:hypothetical protein
MPISQYDFRFMVLHFLPADGRYTRPKHVVGENEVRVFKCCVSSDNQNRRLCAQGDDLLKYALPSQASLISKYKHTQENLLKCSSNMYLTKNVLSKKTVPKYANIKLKGRLPPQYAFHFMVL